MSEGRTAWRHRKALARSTMAFAILVVLMVALVAYANSIAGSTSSQPCTSSGGTTSASSAIKIGYLTELSGNAVSNGYAARIAAELAVNQTNASGGIDG